MSDDARKRFNVEWPAKLFEGGWICATWPEEYGGKGLTTMQGVVLAEEFARAKAPMRGDFFGDTLVGPTLLQWGSEEQKQEFLPGILQGRTRWCQGFSEPDSGSDLASLKTSAVLDGDEWVINGQKVWTTGGHHADYCFLLTRTDPQAPKHKASRTLLVPMRQPGVEVRGITQPDGTAEFCEVFFTDATCPKDNVVGGVNNGWKVANSTLAFERGQSATTGYRRFEDEYRLLVDAARENGRLGDPPRSPAADAVLHEDPDPAVQRAAQPHVGALRIEGSRRRSRSAPATRCSGRRCTSGRWSWRSTCSAPTRC
jgi:alkylation response protein AidB-like acyl-CoA dehydrogenase